MNNLCLNGDNDIFKKISNEWMLITAGNHEKVNTMTASFGGFGVLFFKKVAHIYVRPERYTYEFLERNDTFSLSFFNGQYKEQLTYCGRVSGRDENKIEKCNFTVAYSGNTPYIEQGAINIICKKIYAQDINKDCFKDSELYQRMISSGNLHRMYIGEITEIIEK